MPTHVISPRFAVGNTADNCGTRPRRSERRLDRACSTITATEKRGRFCWNDRLRSTVTNASNSRSRTREVRRSGAPPSPSLVRSSRRVRRSLARAVDRRTRREVPSRRRRDHSSLGLFEKRDELFSLHRRKPSQEVVDGLSALEVIDQRLNRYTRTGEDRCAAQYFRRAGDDRLAHGLYVTPAAP